MIDFQADVHAVATYESAGIYWEAPGAPHDCTLQFRKAGDERWHPALDLWYDKRNDECRGSLVQLQPGTRYEARVTDRKGQARDIAFATRIEQVPVSRVVRIPAGQRTLRIREGGS